MKLVQFNMVAGEREGEDDRVETLTTPVFVNPETVRSVRARKENQPGTRIEFPNSSALIVTEPVDEVVEKLTAEYDDGAS